MPINSSALPNAISAKTNSFSTVNIAKLPELLGEPFSHLFERAWSSSTRRVAL
jgi:hypothetical protein